MSSSLRQPNIPPTFSQQQPSVLAVRIASKRTELENLKQLCDVSGVLASQMQALEEKLATLRDGAEAIACVMANWENVLRAISMASMKVPDIKDVDGIKGNMAQPGGELRGEMKQPPLPVTLVRIPAEQPSPSRS